MQKIIRKINGIDILIDPSKPCLIMLSEDQIKQYNISGALSFREILKLIKRDSLMLPLYLTLELTSKCNLDCKFCYIHGKRKNDELSFEVLRPVLDRLIDWGLLGVTLTGGECTLNKDFALIYKYLKSKGVIVTVYTNGVLLKDSVFEMFSELPPKSVEISIYDTYKNCPQPYENALKLRSMNIDVLIKLTVTTETVDLYEEVKSFSEHNRIPFKFDSDIFDLNTDTKQSSYQIPTEQKVLFDRLKYGKTGLKSYKRNCFNCGAGNVSVFINSEFKLGFCSKAKDWFSLYDFSFDEAYLCLNNIVKRFKDVSLCENYHSCKAKEICHMCYARAIICGENIAADKNYCKSLLSYSEKLYDNWR